MAKNICLSSVVTTHKANKNPKTNKWYIVPLCKTARRASCIERKKKLKKDENIKLGNAYRVVNIFLLPHIPETIEL